MVAWAVVLWTILAVVAAAIVYGSLVGSRRLSVEQVRVCLPRLPKDLAGLRVVHVSDTHVKAKPFLNELYEDMVDAVNAADADLVLLTGDIAAGSENMPLAGRWLKRLRARCGVFAVLGNHDVNVTMERWLLGLLEGYDLGTLRSDLAEVGVRLLHNESVDLSLRGVHVSLVGVGDASCGLDDLRAALAGVPDDALTIVLEHTPDILDRPGIEAADLVVCGHTHGGQMILPGIGPVWAPVWRGRRRGVGLLAAGDVVCHVSRGVGTTWPVRLNCRPQVAILDLEPGRPEGRPVRPKLAHRRRAATAAAPAGAGGAGESKGVDG